MKFKASLRDPRTLSAICQTQRSFSKRVIMKLHPQRLRFIASTNVADGTQVWSACRTDTLLSEPMVMESTMDNAIWLEIEDLTQLVHASRAAERATNVNIRLAKGDSKPLLKFSMQTTQDHHDVTHDVVVRVLMEPEIKNIIAPPLENRNIQIVFPSLIEISAFLESAKNASAMGITFTATANGDGGPRDSTCRLVISAESMYSSFQMTYPAVERIHKAKPPQQQADADGDDDCDLREATVTVETKKFVRFLSVKEVCPTKLVAHIVHDRALVLSAYAIGDTNLVFYIPAMFV